MPNSFSSGKGQLVEPSFGTYVDEWQRPVNSNFGLTDALISGTTTINLSSVPSQTPFVTLVFENFNTSETPWQAPLAGQNIRLVLTGTISYAITVYIPANYPGIWIVDNQTTGSYPVTVKTNALGSTGVQPFQGAMSFIFCDGTNVNYADIGGAVYAISKYVPSSVPVGAIMPFAAATVPNANWLSCNGAAVSRTTYAALFAYIGTLYGSGDGSTTFTLPNLNQGAFISGIGGNAAAIGTLQAESVGPHTHGLNDPGHKHTPSSGSAYRFVTDGPNSAPSNYSGGNPVAGEYFTSTTTTGITINQNTGTSNRPLNYSMLYCIRAL